MTLAVLRFLEAGPCSESTSLSKLGNVIVKRISSSHNVVHLPLNNVAINVT